MVVHAGDRPAGRLREETRHYGVDEAGATGSHEPRTDRDSANAMAGPTHPERARMLLEQAVSDPAAAPSRLLCCHP
jgi:hypothetical protein